MHDEEETCAIVRHAGQIALKFWGKEPRSWQKGRNDPVSEADIAVDRFLKENLPRTTDEQIGWLSEESKDTPTRIGLNYVWIVDPIDGTRAFLRQSENFAVSVALVKNGAPIFGIIYQPATDIMYHAKKGAGAWRNGQQIRASKVNRLEGCRMIADAQFFKTTRHWPRPWPAMTYHKVPAVSLRLARLASNEMDAAVSLAPKGEWDLAAGDLILSEAGGLCVDEAGKRLSYNREKPFHPITIAAAPGLIGPILDHVRPALTLRQKRKTQK